MLEKLELMDTEKIICEAIRDKHTACITREYPEHGVGGLKLWQYRPTKNMQTGEWIGYLGEKGIWLERNLFPFITWENGAWNISDMLNNLEKTVALKSKSPLERGEKDDRIEEIRRQMYKDIAFHHEKV